MAILAIVLGVLGYNQLKNSFNPSQSNLIDLASLSSSSVLLSSSSQSTECIAQEPQKIVETQNGKCVEYSVGGRILQSSLTMTDEEFRGLRKYVFPEVTKQYYQSYASQFEIESLRLDYTKKESDDSYSVEVSLAVPPKPSDTPEDANIINPKRFLMTELRGEFLVRSADDNTPLSTVRSANCNIVEFKDLVKTKDGCFEAYVSRLFVFSQNIGDPNDGVGSPDNPAYSEKLEDYYKTNLGTDFYERIKNLSKTKEIVIQIGGSTKISENKYKVFVSSPDVEYLRSVNMLNTDASRFVAVYTVELRTNRTFELESFNDRQK